MTLLYREMVLCARDAKIPRVGLEVPRGGVSQVSRPGESSLDDDQRRRFGNIRCDVDQEYQDLLGQVVGFKEGYTPTFSRFCEALVVWDTTGKGTRMNWKEYFADRRGTGFMATSGLGGDVDIAVYSRPRVMEDGTLAFGMTDRLTHTNLQNNPKAVYAFQEPGFQGVRIYLEKVREETSGAVLEDVRRRADQVVGAGTGAEVAFLVYFRVVRCLNLVGPGSPE